MAAVRDSGSRGRDLTGDFVSKSTTAESSGQQLQIFAANYNSTRRDKGAGGGGVVEEQKSRTKTAATTADRLKDTMAHTHRHTHPLAHPAHTHTN